MVPSHIRIMPATNDSAGRGHFQEMEKTPTAELNILVLKKVCGKINILL